MFCTVQLSRAFSYWPISSLNGVELPTEICPDGSTAEDRIQKLCEAAAEDIKKCAETCDTYLK